MTVENGTPQTVGLPRASQKLVVRASARRLRLVGDPTVESVVVTGPHTLRRTARTIEVTSYGELSPSFDGLGLLRGPLAGSLLGAGLGGRRKIGLDDLKLIKLGKEVVLRVNPLLLVQVELTAGKLESVDIPRLGRVRVTAGQGRCEGLRQAGDVLVQASNVTLAGSFDRGRSRVQVESGSLSVGLDEAADVTVTADARLGRVSWPGSGAVDEFVAGEGTAKLELVVLMGQAQVRQAEPLEGELIDEDQDEEDLDDY